MSTASVRSQPPISDTIRQSSSSFVPSATRSSKPVAVPKEINIYETTAEESHRNPFIKQQALFQLNIANFDKRIESGIYDTTYLIAAEESLLGAEAIALEQIKEFKSVDFRYWLRCDRWSCGSWALLLSKWQLLQGNTNVDRIEAQYQAFLEIVKDLDGSIDSSKVPCPVFHGRFNQVVQAGNAYQNCANGTNIKRQYTVFSNLLSNVRSITESLYSSEDAAIVEYYTRGPMGDVYAGNVLIILDCTLDFKDPGGAYDELKKDYLTFVRAWNDTYNQKLGLRLIYGHALVENIQKSIEMYIYYDKCGPLRRMLVSLAEESKAVWKRARENIEKVAEQAVTWEFLKSGFMVAFWPIIAPICLAVDYCQGNTWDHKTNNGTSWYHGMNKQITGAWNKSPATLFFVTFGIVGSVVFISLATAASFGAVPAVAAALTLTHASVACSSLAIMGLAAGIGGYAWKREQQLRIENEAKQETKLLEDKKTALRKELKKKEDDAAKEKAKAQEVAEDQDEEAALKAEEDRLRAELEAQLKARRTQATRNRTTKPQDAKKTEAPLPPRPPSTSIPSEETKAENISVSEAMNEMKRKRDELLSTINEAQAQEISVGIDEVRNQLQTELNELELRMCNIQASMTSSNMNALRQASHTS